MGDVPDNHVGDAIRAIVQHPIKYPSEFTDFLLTEWSKLKFYTDPINEHKCYVCSKNCVYIVYINPYTDELKLMKIVRSILPTLDMRGF